MYVCIYVYMYICRCEKSGSCGSWRLRKQGRCYEKRAAQSCAATLRLVQECQSAIPEMNGPCPRWPGSFIEPPCGFGRRQSEECEEKSKPAYYSGKS